MNKQPLVSIIIPTYNRAHLIGETLDSVLAQTYPNWECIVVDDGSTDTTDEVVQQYLDSDTRFQYHHRPADRPKGANACRNYGFEVSKGQFIMFLDSDDLFIDTTIGNRVKYLLNEKIDLLITNSQAFNKCIGDSKILWNLMNENHTHKDLIIRFFKSDMPWSTNSVTWNKIFFKKIKGWNEGLTAWQDWEIHCKSLFYNPKIMIVNALPDNFFRNSQHSKIGDSFTSLAYIKSLYLIVCEIDRLLKKHTLESEKVINHFNDFVIHKTIILALKNRYFFLPLTLLFKREFIIGLKRWNYFKIYLVQLFGISFKIRKYVLGKIYYDQQQYYKINSNHLKFTLDDLKTNTTVNNDIN